MWDRIKKGWESFRPPLPGDAPDYFAGEGERVVLLHGLWRSHKAMGLLAEDLQQEGFEVVNIPYRSFLDPLDEIVGEVQGILAALPEKRTNFVTHSMGGIVVRRLAQRFPGTVNGRVVMLAPPNQGSELVDWLEDVPGIRYFLGPAGLELATQKVRSQLPQSPPSLETAVIMGDGGFNPLFQSLLPGENDGTVTVEGGKLEGLEHFSVLKAGHARTMLRPEVISQVKCFLNHGTLEPEKA